VSCSKPCRSNRPPRSIARQTEYLYHCVTEPFQQETKRWDFAISILTQMFVWSEALTQYASVFLARGISSLNSRSVRDCLLEITSRVYAAVSEASLSKGKRECGVVSHVRRSSVIYGSRTTCYNPCTRPHRLRVLIRRSKEIASLEFDIEVINSAPLELTVSVRGS
jgi:hypothetical protein